MISPRLHRAAVALAELGVGPEGALATAEKLRRHADGVARTFVDLFVREVWEPFDRAGRPEGDWPKVREALDRMRPLASDALLCGLPDRDGGGGRAVRRPHPAHGRTQASLAEDEAFPRVAARRNGRVSRRRGRAGDLPPIWAANHRHVPRSDPPWENSMYIERT